MNIFSNELKIPSEKFQSFNSKKIVDNKAAREWYLFLKTIEY